MLPHEAIEIGKLRALALSVAMSSSICDVQFCSHCCAQQSARSSTQTTWGTAGRCSTTAPQTSLRKRASTPSTTRRDARSASWPSTRCRCLSAASSTATEGWHVSWSKRRPPFHSTPPIRSQLAQSSGRRGWELRRGIGAAACLVQTLARFACDHGFRVRSCVVLRACDGCAGAEKGVRGSQGAIRSSSACCRSGSEVRAVLSAMLATLTEMAGGAVDGVLRRGAASHGLLRVQRQAGAVPPLVLHPEVLHTHVVARPSVLERRFSVFGLAVSGFAMRYAVLTAAVRLQGGADASGSQGDPGRGDDGSTPLLLLLRI